MSDIIRRATENVMRSPVFMETLSKLFLQEMEKQLRQEAGGDYVYIPKTGDAAEKTTRDAQIRAKFKGNNAHELCKEFALSPRQIRRICSMKNKSALI